MALPTESANQRWTTIEVKWGNYLGEWNRKLLFVVIWLSLWSEQVQRRKEKEKKGGGEGAAGGGGGGGGGGWRREREREKNVLESMCWDFWYAWKIRLCNDECLAFRGKDITVWPWPNFKDMRVLERSNWKWYSLYYPREFKLDMVLICVDKIMHPLDSNFTLFLHAWIRSCTLMFLYIGMYLWDTTGSF